LKLRSRTNEQQHEPTFFVDENLCGLFAARLRLAGVKIEELSSHLSRGTPDVVWLPFVGEKGWVAITMDSLKGDPEEQLALMLHGVKVFVLVGKATHQERADFFLKKLRWVRRAIAEHDEPFMARLSITSGDHSMTRLEDLMNRYARRRR
jgi:hypothetical protein